MRTPKASPCQGEVPNKVRRRGYTSRKKVQSGKSRLHLLFTANIQRQLLTNSLYRIRRRVAKPRRVSIEWNDAQNIGSRMNSEAESTKRVQTPLFSPPFFSGKTEKKGPSETYSSYEFAKTSQSAFG